MTGAPATSRFARRSTRAGNGIPQAVLSPITREPVHDRVYRELRQALIFGTFDPGQVLTIQDLASTLQTSTMPIRDALARLVSEQALENLPNRSVRVPLINASRLDDLLRARIVIEGAALELAAPRLTREDFATLRQSIVAYDAALAARGRTAIEEELKANHAFHLHLYRASGSAVLLPIIDSLWLQSGPVVRAAVSAFDPASEISAPHYHVEIVTALEAGDVAAAQFALDKDISRAFSLLRSRFAAEAAVS